MSMKAREFLLGLMIFLILGAWAASAEMAQKESWKPKAYGVLASGELPEVDSGGLASYFYDEMTTWKAIQLQAVAMTNPSKLSDYVVLDSLPAVEFLKELKVSEENFDGVSAWQDLHVGYLTAKGQFIAIDPNIYMCSECEDIASWRKGMTAFTTSDEYKVLLQKVGSEFEADVSGMDLHVVWQDGAAIKMQFDQMNQILVKPNY